MDEAFMLMYTCLVTLRGDFRVDQSCLDDRQLLRHCPNLQNLICTLSTTSLDLQRIPEVAHSDTQNSTLIPSSSKNAHAVIRISDTVTWIKENIVVRSQYTNARLES